MQNVFKPFFATKGSGEGTGMGLYICEYLIKSVNGHVEVESEAGKGSTFRIILPDFKNPQM